jgi:hypothetical protein
MIHMKKLEKLAEWESENFTKFLWQKNKLPIIEISYLS